MSAQEKKALTIIRRRQVEARTGLSRSAIYSRLKPNPKRPGDYDPTFPKPVQLGAKSVGWVESEVEDWLMARVLKCRTTRGVAA